MEGKQELRGSYKIQSIILVEFSFWRKDQIDFNGERIKNSIDISTEAGENVSAEIDSPEEKTNLIVSVILSVNATQNEELVFTIKTKMTGIFLKEGTPALPEEGFKKVNAPAIIYPFIREQVASTCLKAGLGNVFLPPVNFIERNK